MRSQAGSRSVLLLFLLLMSLFAGAVVQAQEQNSPNSGFNFTKIDLQLLDDINEVDRQVAKKGLIFENPDLQAYMDSVCKRVIAERPTPEKVQFRCLVLRDPMQNAFAEPNGTVYVTTGLLSLLENEAELAGVLGHEVTHTFNRHLYLENRSMRKKVLTINIINAVASVAPGGPGVSSGVQLFGAAAQLGAAVTSQILIASVYGYSREKEQEADTAGLSAMVAASYDPGAMARSFELLDQGSRYEFEPFDSFYHDHPKLAERRKFALDFATAHPVTGARQAAEKDYLLQVAPAISYNVTADINGRRARSAVRCAQRLVNAFPEEPKYQLLLGDAYRALGAKTTTLSEEELTRHGKSEDRKNFFSRTEQEEQKRLAEKPEGQAALKENQAQAEKLYLAVAQSNPNYADTYRDLGFLYEEQGRYPEAAAVYRHFLDIVAGTSLDHLRVERRLANVQKLNDLTSPAK
ncbi:M48 family metalloprotease [Telmatobacter sp. DSM 110680]|uniref:M48 family metalloprotease n=1 Tax=Telmatobacter sp. DSM 110680 TaxID=3036704 RepID=A0AAU7DJT4_9BACT